MNIPMPVRLFAALLPILVSPLIFALGKAGQASFVLGLMLGSFFVATLMLPWVRRAA